MRLIDADRLILYLNNYALSESPAHDGDDDKVYQAIMNCIDAVEEAETVGDASREAINAIKKQIPLTPCYINDGYSDGELVYDEWECPSCGKAYELDVEQYDYCPNCGQRINWREEWKHIGSGGEDGSTLPI